MATIKLADAAKFDQQLPHQLAAWNGLQATLTAKQLEDFAETFRAAGTGARDPFRPNSGFDYQLTPFPTGSSVSSHRSAAFTSSTSAKRA